jgi:hypothetical protein
LKKIGKKSKKFGKNIEIEKIRKNLKKSKKFGKIEKNSKNRKIAFFLLHPVIVFNEIRKSTHGSQTGIEPVPYISKNYI